MSTRRMGRKGNQQDVAKADWLSPAIPHPQILI